MWARRVPWKVISNTVSFLGGSAHPLPGLFMLGLQTSTPRLGSLSGFLANWVFWQAETTHWKPALFCCLPVSYLGAACHHISLSYSKQDYCVNTIWVEQLQSFKSCVSPYDQWKSMWDFDSCKSPGRHHKRILQAVLFSSGYMEFIIWCLNFALILVTVN